MSDPHNPFQHRIRIRPYGSDDAPRLEIAAARDKHGVAAPSHVMEKDGEIVGYLSINMVPTVLLWMDSKVVRVHDTIDIVNFYENFISAMGWKGFFLPVPTDSPLKPYVESAGYTPASPTGRTN